MELLFVNDTPLQITKDVKVLNAYEQYDHCLMQGLDSIELAKLIGTVLIRLTQEEFYQLLELLQEQVDIQLKGITAVIEDYQDIRALLQGKFKLVKAAGGVVSKGNRVLLIHRRNRWDLPKGKRNKGEKSTAAAVREVEEECSVKVKLLAKICTTWHTYTRKSFPTLKKTTWYAMSCVNDTHMQPQLEEGIEQVTWICESDVQAVLQTTYPSVQYVYQAYLRYQRDTLDSSFLATNGKGES